MEQFELFQKFALVSFTIAFFWKLIRHMLSFVNVEKEPVRVLITGAAGMFSSSSALHCLLSCIAIMFDITWGLFVIVAVCFSCFSFYYILRIRV